MRTPDGETDRLHYPAPGVGGVAARLRGDASSGTGFSREADPLRGRIHPGRPELLPERWSQQVVIENRPGAGGNVAAEAVAKSAPDGYTWLLGNNSILATNQSLYRSLGYDPVKDFAPVSLVAVQPNILVVNPQVPVHSVVELI